MKKSSSGYASDVNAAQNVTSEMVENVSEANEAFDPHTSEITYKQITDSKSTVFQMDAMPVDFGSFKYLEHCDDSTIILHKDLPYECEGSSQLDIPSFDLDDDLEANQENDLTDHTQDSDGDNSQESSVTVTKIDKGQNCKSENPVDTEVVWLPASSPKHQLQEFLAFPNQEMMDENVSTVSSDGTSTAHMEKKEMPKVEADKSISPSSSKDMVNKSIVTKGTENKVIAPVFKTNEKIKHPYSLLDKKNDVFKCFTLSKMDICKEWLRCANLSSYLQTCRLYSYICSKVNFDTVKETRKHVWNLVSFITHKLSEMFAKCGRNPKALINNNHTWLKGPHIGFTPNLSTQNLGSTPVYRKTYIAPSHPNQSHPLLNRPQKVTVPKELYDMSLDTNGDLFKFLTKSKPQFKAETLHLVLMGISRDTFKADKTLKPAKLKEFCERYVSDIKFKFMTTGNKEDVFKTKFDFWLRLNVRWPEFIKNVLSTRKVPKLDDGIAELEKSIAKICGENGKEDIVNVIHRLLYHPDDAARIRAFVENSNCSCNNPEKSVKVEEIGSTDGLLKLASDKSRNNNESGGLRLTKDNTLERVYKAPSGPRLDALKQVLNKLKDDTDTEPPITKETEPRNKLNLVVEKLKTGTDESDPLELPRRFLSGSLRNIPRELLKNVPRNALKWVPLESLKRVSHVSPASTRLESPASTRLEPPASTRLELPASTRLEPPACTRFVLPETVPTPTIIERSHDAVSDTELEFGPVLDRILYIKPELSAKNGTRVCLSKGRMATLVKVSNLRGTSVLLPISNIKRGAKVHAKGSIVKRNRFQTSIKKTMEQSDATSFTAKKATVSAESAASTNIQKSMALQPVPTIKPIDIPLRVTAAPSNKVPVRSTYNKIYFRGNTPAILRKQAVLKEKSAFVAPFSTKTVSMYALKGNLQQSETMKNRQNITPKSMVANKPNIAPKSMVPNKPKLLNFKLG